MSSYNSVPQPLKCYLKIPNKLHIPTKNKPDSCSCIWLVSWHHLPSPKSKQKTNKMLVTRDSDLTGRLPGRRDERGLRAGTAIETHQ